jgi:hypothetical protein
MLRSGTPIAADPVSTSILRRIHRDEARHVRIARSRARSAGVDRSMRDTAAAVRGEFADLLALASAEFEALSVDPAWLDRVVRQLPDGLFTR